MRYDLKLIQELCGEIGFPCSVRAPNELAIELEHDLVLCFYNFDKEDDCLVEFEGTSWHGHGDFQFLDRHGKFIEMTYFDVIAGLNDGHVLVCELWNRGALLDRWLVHRDYVDEFGYMEDGDEIRIRKISKRLSSPSP